MKMTISKTLTSCLLALGVANAATAQNETKLSNGFTRTASGMEYKFIKHGDGKRKAAAGDHAEIFIHVFLEDSSIFDSRKMYNATKPVPVTVQQPKANGDLMEGFLMMAAGDSALFNVPADSMKKVGMPPMPGYKEGAGQMIRYQVQMVTLRSEAEEKKYNEEQASKQVSVDEAAIQDYLKKHKVKNAKKTASGLYYSIAKQGTGPMPKAGQMMSVNYTGMLLNGNKFDSNTDSAFHHVEAFKLAIGKGQVIKGWDEGLMLFNKGTKATLYIPSGLAYGSQDRSPQIPANSVLVFEVEIKAIEDAQPEPPAPGKVDPSLQAKADDKLIQEYLAKNNIKAERTASGLYYSIKEQGVGEKPTAGKKVTMNYTGHTLDGKVFDSNVDPKFNHVSPFSFTLGVGQVIRGWDEGVALLKLGTKGSFYIPSGMAYGPNGAGGGIPPNSVLVFDVELVGID